MSVQLICTLQGGEVIWDLKFRENLQVWEVPKFQNLIGRKFERIACYVLFLLFILPHCPQLFEELVLLP